MFEEARARREIGQGTLLFVDEIHRFNRAQQDSFLPVMEDGTIVLVGATTENPSFELIAPMLSRARVLVFKSLDRRGGREAARRAPRQLEGKKLPLDADARLSLARMADGDGRASLTLAEEIWRAARPGEIFDRAGLQKVVQRRAPIYDKKQDGHYNLISALHKSVRGSDPDAALYYLARMLDAGEDPLYLARRVVRMAVEDIGLADPQALVICNAAKDAYDFLGSPEGELAIAEAVIYVATAPKSNAAYVAYGAAKRAAKENGSLLPPKHILNAPTNLMKSEGYGRGYAYDHDAEEAFSGQDYFPEELGRQTFYDPPERGFEREIRKRLDYWAKLRKDKAAGDRTLMGRKLRAAHEIALSPGGKPIKCDGHRATLMLRFRLAACAIGAVRCRPRRDGGVRRPLGGRSRRSARRTAATAPRPRRWSPPTPRCGGSTAIAASARCTRPRRSMCRRIAAAMTSSVTLDAQGNRMRVTWGKRQARGAEAVQLSARGEPERRLSEAAAQRNRCSGIAPSRSTGSAGSPRSCRSTCWWWRSAGSSMS